MFTIIIANHERPLLLKRTLASLIAQTCQDFNVIVVSDTPGFLPPYPELSQLAQRFTYVLRAIGPAGAGASRNLGLTLADAEYILFLDDDDSYRPDHLAQLKQRLLQDKPALLFHDFLIENEDRSVHPPRVLPGGRVMAIGDVTADSLYVRNRIPNSCIAYRRDVLHSVRNDTQLVIYEDWDFLLNAVQGHGLVHFAHHGVVIHKSEATSPENMRCGNSHDDQIVPTILEMYRRHPAPTLAIRQARQAYMSNAGMALDLSYF